LIPLEVALIYLFRTLFDGHFEGTIPTWAFIGARSPWDGAMTQTLGAIQGLDVPFGGKREDLGDDT
jgi:hypothetical protein